MSTNDREYWDKRFQGDWVAHGGPEQTRFFTSIALDAMPGWFTSRIRSMRMTLCDWGCAEGEGAALIASRLGIPVVGIDFSEAAITRAIAKYPAIDFRAADLLEKDENWNFDIVFSSNTLEHFHDPWKVFDTISRYASRYMVLLVPYREEELHPEHFAGFEPTNILAVRGDWTLMHAAVLDARHLPHSQWNGKQILAIYARGEEISSAQVPLAELRIDTPELESYRDELLALRALAGDAENNFDALQRAIDRTRRAEGVLQWSMRVWGHATEQRQAMEALTGAVISLQERLVHAIGVELARMQQEQARTVRDAERKMASLEREHAAAIAAATAEISALQVRYSQDLEAAGEDIARMQAQHAGAMEAAAALAARLRDAEQETRDAEQETRDAETREIELQGRLEHVAAVMADQSRRLSEAEETLRLVRASSSWRITRPLRFVRRLLHHGLSVEDRIRLGAAARRAAARMPMPESLRARLMLGRNAEAGVVLRPLDLLPTDDEVSQFPDRLASQQAGMADVFVWSVIDWHFRTQRPQHLARALAGKGHRVFYLSNNLVDAQEPGYSLDPLDEERRLFQVHLNVSKAPSIYHGLPTPRQAAQLRASLAALLGWTRTRKSISLVQHPFWSGPAQSLPNAHVVYDCMDHHAGFENNASSILAAETDLIEGADLVIASSAWLRDELSSRNEKVALIRNGTDHEHFRTAPAAVFRDEQGRQVIGYYGAIADWFDTGLVRRVAQDHPEALVLLIGSDTAGAALSLRDLPNVHFTGEVAYRDLPYWVHGFDVCLLPFRVLPLTLATNPVKVYEYLSAGKPVVAVDLPEMGQFDGLVTVAADPSAFSAAVGRVLAGPRDPAAMAARQNFAAQQTWDHRASEIDRAIKAIVEPTVSVIVLTYNNVALTKACLLSLECNSDYPGLEVIVVDNASNDGSREFLRKWQGSGSRRKLILNDSNLGFATGNNQGLEAATGDVLVMLNNDTYVTPGWVRTLLWHLRRDPAVGLVGPVTNNIGNEAKIEINYGDMREMIAESAHYTLAHAGRSLPLEAIAFFCVMMRRQVYERVGGLDEAFGIGFFEDDDYCRRVTECGWKIVCAEDVFVHHHLSASFGAMEDTLRQELFLRNKAIYEAKWGAWVPHAYRSKG